MIIIRHVVSQKGVRRLPRLPASSNMNIIADRVRGTCGSNLSVFTYVCSARAGGDHLFLQRTDATTDCKDNKVVAGDLFNKSELLVWSQSSAQHLSGAKPTAATGIISQRRSFVRCELYSHCADARRLQEIEKACGTEIQLLLRHASNQIRGRTTSGSCQTAIRLYCDTKQPDQAGKANNIRRAKPLRWTRSTRRA